MAVRYVVLIADQMLWLDQLKQRARVPPPLDAKLGKPLLTHAPSLDLADPAWDAALQGYSLEQRKGARAYVVDGV